MEEEQDNFIVTSWDAFQKWFRANWLNSLVFILGSTGLVITILTILAVHFINIEVRRRLEDKEVQAGFLSQLSKDVVGLSYSVNFTISKDPTSFDHFIPIFVTKHATGIQMFVRISHDGQLNKFRKIDIYLDREKLDFDPKNDNPFVRTFSLDKAIALARDRGEYEVNENTYILDFRADPVQETDDVASVQVLINILGLQDLTTGPAIDGAKQ